MKITVKPMAKYSEALLHARISEKVKAAFGDFANDATPGKVDQPSNAKLNVKQKLNIHSSHNNLKEFVKAKKKIGLAINRPILRDVRAHTRDTMHTKQDGKNPRSIFGKSTKENVRASFQDFDFGFEKQSKKIKP